MKGERIMRKNNLDIIDKEGMYDLIVGLTNEKIRFELNDDTVKIVIKQWNGSETIEITKKKTNPWGHYDIHRIDDDHYWREHNVNEIIEMIREIENYG